MKQIPESYIRAWMEANFECKERRDGDELVICCPFDDDSDFKFNVSPSKGVCHYWRGDHWAPVSKKDKRKRDTSFIRFVSLYLKCTVPQAVKAVMGADATRYLANARLLGATEPEPEPEEENQMTLPVGAYPVVDSPFPKLAKGLMRWLASRGVSEADVARHRIHHVGSDVIWPYYEFDRLVYWQLRSRLSKRFQFPSKEKVGVGKEDFLYGFDLVNMRKHVIITEAIFDAHAVGDQAMASGGASLTGAQVDKLKMLRPTDVILAPDNDLAGMESLIKNAKMLRDVGYSVWAAVPPKLRYVKSGEAHITKDWNEIGQYVTGWEEGVQKVFAEAATRITDREMIRLRGLVFAARPRRKFD